MVHSVYTARCLLHAVALVLAVCAVSNQSWDEIDLLLPETRASAAKNISSSVNSSAIGTDDRTTSIAAQSDSIKVDKVTFAPGRYCVHHVNATTRVCHEYAFLLNRIGSSTDDRDSFPRYHHHAGAVVHAATEHDGKGKSKQDKQVDRVLASWCMVQEDGSWFVQGAESMVCLVVLDTCLYTMVFWVVFGSLTTCFSLVGVLWPTTLLAIESFNAFCSYASAALGVFLALEWWGYGAYFIDQAYLHSLSLTWRYGSAFHLLVVSMVLSTVAARITLHLAIATRANYAQLHASPPSPGSASTPSSREEGEQQCQRDENPDPLQCPANYHV